MAKVALRFYLDDGRDADLLIWLDGQVNRSETIRQALRAWLGDGADPGDRELSPSTLRQVLREELGRIGMSTTSVTAPEHAQEDDELRGAMGNLLSTWEFEEQA